MVSWKPLLSCSRKVSSCGQDIGADDGGATDAGEQQDMCAPHDGGPTTEVFGGRKLNKLWRRIKMCHPLSRTAPTAVLMRNVEEEGEIMNASH